ncbi:MAG TPA: hypothetical protein VH370_12610 [Humisphaera sp.]|jgi:hypothetical protein|nr:hypothetical protein [Humisphaera sp.]
MSAPAAKQLSRLLDELSGIVEELLLAGLTAASQSTIERLDVTFKEASRLKLLRLGSNLRLANEEITRFTSGSQQFSARRLAFFLGRTWLLAAGMKRAISAGDDERLSRLMAVPRPQPAEKLSVIVLGVNKRIVPGAFATFEFRLRVIQSGTGAQEGESLVWSCVFPLRKDLDLPAEAFLHLPQKQKFRPSILLERKTITIEKCEIARQGGTARVILNDASQITAGADYTEWSRWWKWDASAAKQRLISHQPTPLDLDVELAEEVVLDQWEAGAKQSSEEGFDTLPMSSAGLDFEARLDRGLSGKPLHGTVLAMAGKKKRPPLFGLVHYEACKFVFQPLTALGKDGPEYLTVSPDKISQVELVKAMKFT